MNQKIVTYMTIFKMTGGELYGRKSEELSKEVCSDTWNPCHGSIPHQDCRCPGCENWWRLGTWVGLWMLGDQALTGTRYPTLPGFYFYYPYPTRKFFQNFRVQGSNYTCCFQSRIISMMPANRLRRKRNLLKIVKIERNAEHLQFIMEMALILLKRRGGNFLFMSFISKLLDQVPGV